MNPNILEPFCCPDCASAFVASNEGLVCNGCGVSYRCSLDTLGDPLLYLLPAALRQAYEGEGPSVSDTTTQSTKISELHYRQNVAHTETAREGATVSSKTRTHLDWQRYMVKTYFPFFDQKGSDLRLMEIGAGYCGTLAHVKRLLSNRVPSYAVDISDVLLGQIAPHAIQHVGVENSSIVKIVGDFEALPFADNTIDILICDAVLHHAEDLPKTVRECRRVLRPDGWMYIQREPTFSILRRRGQIRRQTEIPDMLEGAIEKIYSFSEWTGALRVAGFAKVEVIPVGRLPMHKIKRRRLLAHGYNIVFDRSVWRKNAAGRFFHLLTNRMISPSFVMVAHG